MRRREFSMPFGLVAALTLCLALAGCIDPRSYPSGRVVEAHVVKVDTVIDPVTGRVTLVTHWLYDDGVTRTTEDSFKKDTPVEDRRATSRAPIRVVDIP